MTNTTFRKRALLSSVAMLLVALVAMGSATFAWFTTTPTANATGLHIQTTTADGLVAISDTEKTAWGEAYASHYSHNTTLKAIDTDATDGVTIAADATVAALTPLSLQQTTSGTETITYGLQWWTATAAADDDKTAATEAGGDKYTTTSPENNTNYYTEKVYFKGSNGGAVTVASAKVTITETASYSLTSAIRVTLVDKNNQIIGTWGVNASDSTYAPVASATTVGSATLKYNGSTASGLNLAMAANGNDYITVIVWLDGEDTNCYSTAVINVNELASQIDVQFSK